MGIRLSPGRRLNLPAATTKRCCGDMECSRPVAPLPREASCRTAGGCSTCTGMSGSGAGMGMRSTMRSLQRSIRRGRAGVIDRVGRGGGWINSRGNAGASYRNGFPPDFRNFHLGFRVARSQSRDRGSESIGPTDGAGRSEGRSPPPRGAGEMGGACGCCTAAWFYV